MLNILISIVISRVDVEGKRAEKYIPDAITRELKPRANPSESLASTFAPLDRKLLHNSSISQMLDDRDGRPELRLQGMSELSDASFEMWYDELFV